ncbi:MAG TPA: helix-turn-helix domain-containing protein [Aggregatilineaceae bacterium]|nr:helix-turn-helix domain-containing protein [Aggregatilineaceae bacterium]
MRPSSEWVSLGEAAEIIGVHPATIRNWAQQGELPFRRTPGGHRRFRRSDLEHWLASYRARQPTDAQVVVQSALGRARLEIGDRQTLTNLDWYRQLSPEAREIMRQEGLRLMDALISYLANSDDNADLDTAHEIGRTYGDLLKGQGLTLSQALKGYFYFVDFLLEAVIQLSETSAAHSTGNWGQMLRQVNLFTRETLVGMIAVYELP